MSLFTNSKNDPLRHWAHANSTGLTLTPTHALSLAFVALTISNSACISTGNEITGLPATNASATPTPAAVPAGAKAVRIIFSNTTSGSFPTTSSAGTVAAVRVFNPNNSILSSDSSSDSWPQWLPKIEIGLTTNRCANFSNDDDAAAVCDFNRDTTADVNCGVAQNLYRVSEYDCTSSPATAVGNGGSNDAVFIRATINRNTAYLGAQENIMAVLEYAASGIHQAPANPTLCFSGGKFNPTSAQCSDFVWQGFLKRSLYEVAQPYLLIAPPMTGYIDATNNRGGGGTTTKQMILPLAGDSTLNIFQMSRTSTLPNADLGTAGCRANSAQCAGIVFYSLTFYRI